MKHLWRSHPQHPTIVVCIRCKRVSQMEIDEECLARVNIHPGVVSRRRGCGCGNRKRQTKTADSDRPTK